MTYNQKTEDLWYTLLSLDNTWQYGRCTSYEVVLINSAGQEIHASTEESALYAAIGLSRPVLKNNFQWE